MFSLSVPYSNFTICDFVADMRAPTPSAAAELAVPDKEDLQKHLAGTSTKLASVLSQRIQGYRSNLKYLRESGVLSGASPLLNEKRMTLLYLAKQLDGDAANAIRNSQNRLASVTARLDALSPLSVLARGYSVATNAEGNAVRGVSDVKQGDEISVRVKDGTINASVISISKEKKKNGKKQ